MIFHAPFEQFAELMKEVPFPNLIQKNVVNSKYTNYTLNQKKHIFCGRRRYVEDCAYMFGSNIRVKDCFDTYRVGDLELCYGVVDCEKSSRLFLRKIVWDVRIQRCSMIAGNCVDCFVVWAPRNKQYHVFNQPYSKEEYKRRLILPISTQHLDSPRHGLNLKNVNYALHENLLGS